MGGKMKSSFTRYLVAAGIFLLTACGQATSPQGTLTSTVPSSPSMTPTEVTLPTGTPTLTSTPTLIPLPSGTATQTPTPTNTAIPKATRKVTQCPGAPDIVLKLGEQAMVSVDPPLPNNLRSKPGTAGELIGKIQPGEIVQIEDGPRCADSLTWWYVSVSDGLEGWTAEGDAENYWLVPFEQVSEDSDSTQETVTPTLDSTTSENSVTLTADQVKSAVDIEGAISRVTADGTRPGTVILDGQKGAFVYTEDDWAINLWRSNLNLLGVNGAKFENCDGGLSFDDVKLENILVEGIEFNCTGNAISSNGAHKNVTLRDNIIRSVQTAISLAGLPDGWSITQNKIESEGDGIEINGGRKVLISNNQIVGISGIILRNCDSFQIFENEITASDQGILVGLISTKNLIEKNTIQNVSRVGITLEPGAKNNQILNNVLTCTRPVRCIIVDAQGEAAEANTISGNSR
jgi:nitrous oxidase accessory protein NosD